MNARWIKTLSLLVVVVLIAGGSVWQFKFNKDWREKYAYAKGVDALIYAFPYFLDSALLYKWSLPPTAANDKGPAGAANNFWHSPELTDPKQYRDGGMPNRDTLYSIAWVYAKQEPIILSIPAIAGGRYYTFELAGFDSDNFSSVGKRTHGNGGGHYAIVPPGWEGELPADVEYLAENPTPWFLILGRTMIDPNDAEDLLRVSALQDNYRLVAMSDWGKDNPPRPEHPPIDDVGELSEILAGSDIVSFLKRLTVTDPMAFWKIVNRAMTINGVPDRDHSRLVDWAGLHLGPNQDISKLSDSERAGLSSAVFDGIMMLRDYGSNGYDSKAVNGWLYPHRSTGRSGVAGYYMSRAGLQSMKGIVANDAEEAVYIPVTKDQYGDEINGKHDYEIHFSPEQIPQASEFWSLTLYDDDGNLVLNPIDRYSISDRSEHLVYEPDGSLKIYVGKNSPAGKESNWLPADEQRAVMVLRVYGPAKEIIEQTWQPPAVRRL